MKTLDWNELKLDNKMNLIACLTRASIYDYDEVRTALNSMNPTLIYKENNWCLSSHGLSAVALYLYQNYKS